jgi:methyl-accepting chemotaxis protein
MRFTIKAKLALSFGVIIVLSLGAGLLAIRDLSDVNAGMNQLIDGPVERVRVAQQIETGFANLALEEKNMILADNDQDMDKYETKS